MKSKNLTWHKVLNSQYSCPCYADFQEEEEVQKFCVCSDNQESDQNYHIYQYCEGWIVLVVTVHSLDIIVLL